MTSPNVGKISLDAVIDSKQLKPQLDALARDMQAKLLPEMDKLDKTIADVNKEIGNIKAKPYEDLAKAAGKVADGHKKTATALKSEESAQLALAKAQERSRKAQLALTNLQKKINDTGKITENQKQRLLALENAAGLAATATAQAERNLGRTRKEIRDAQIGYHRDIAAAAFKSTQEQIRDAKRLTDEMEREARKRKSILDRQAADEAKARRVRSSKIDDVRRGILGPVDVIGEIARGFGGLGRLSTPAFNTVVLGALAAAGAVASLSKAVFLLPAAFSAAAFGVGTLVVGLQGFGDTMKVLMEGDMEKFSVSLRNLSPNAQQAALGIQALLPRFKELRLAVQEALFANAEPMITGLTDRFLPTIQKGMTGVATALNRAFTGVAEVLMRPETLRQTETIMSNIVRAFELAGPSLASFSQAFVTLTEAGSSFLPGLAESFAKMAENFAKFIDEKNRSGELGEWIQRGLDTAGILVSMIWDLGRAFMSLAPVAEQILPPIATILDNIADILQAHPALIYAIPAAFVGWSVIKGVFDLITNLGLIAIALKTTMPAAAATAATGIRAAFLPLVATGGVFALMLAAVGGVILAMDQLTKKVQDSQLSIQQLQALSARDIENLRQSGTIIPPGVTGQPVVPGAPLGGSGLLGGPVVAGPAPGQPGFIGPVAPGALPPGQGGGLPSILGGGFGGGPSRNIPGAPPLLGPTQPPVDPDHPLPVDLPPVPPGQTPPWLPAAQNLPLPPLPPEDGAGGGADKGPKLGDYLSGKARGPLTEISDANKQMLTQLQNQIKKTPMPGTTMGPFGTPLRPRNRGYEMAAAAISALGGQPEVFIGENPIDVAEREWKDFLDRVADTTTSQLEPLLQQPVAGTGGLGTIAQGAAGFRGPAGANWDALAGFESSGNWAANTGNGFFGGLQFTKETWMANKPSGAPDEPWRATREQQIAAAENVLKTQGKGAWPAAAAQHPEWFQPQPGMALPTGGMPTSQVLARPSILHDTGGTGSGAAAINAAALIAQYFPQITDIGGSRAGGAAPGTHTVGKAIDIMIPDFDTPQGVSLGNQIRDFFQQNAEALDVVYTIWQNQGLQTGLGGRTPGGTFTAGGHMDHIDVQFGDGGGMSIGPGGVTAPGGVPGVPSGIAGLGMGTGGVTPVFVTNWPGQAQGAPQGQQLFNMLGQTLLNPLAQAGGQVAGDVAGDVAASALGAILPQARSGPPSSLDQLVKERNPLAIAAAAGLNVPSFQVQGGGPSAQDLMTTGGPAFDAMGRVFSDTAALLDRSFSTMEAAARARHEQLLSVMNQIADRVGVDLLEPVVSSGVTAGVEGVSKEVNTQIGYAMGQAAAGPIADAVRDAIPPAPPPSAAGGGGAGGGIGSMLGSALFDEGGEWPSGTAGFNLSGSTERVLSPAETAAFDAGLLGGWNLQPMQQHMATTSGVIGNETVGAEFFGVSQIPIIGLIVNLLVRVLLAVLGVQIEIRDTLDEMTDTFREFRGEFKAFDAMGRLMNDTSALIERSSTSEQAAADERIRILKIVINALIKYIIEKVIVPIGKAVANSLIQAGASAAGAAINTQAPGAGGIVSSLISSAGSAGVDIVAEVGADLAIAFFEVFIDAVGEGAQSYFPDIVNAIFGGGLLAGVADPLVAGIFDPILGLFGGLFGAFGGSAFDLGGLFGGLFDDGGLALGTGLMPKATIEPERVLSPHQTASFDRLVAVLERGGLGSPRTTTIHAPFTVTGGEHGALQARNKLLALMS